MRSPRGDWSFLVDPLPKPLPGPVPEAVPELVPEPVSEHLPEPMDSMDPMEYCRNWIRRLFWLRFQSLLVSDILVPGVFLFKDHTALAPTQGNESLYREKALRFAPPTFENHDKIK
jgi:hypothetical protein